MAAVQVLDIRVINCGGMRDLMSEMESSFLVSALGLFRNEQNFGLGKPRANVNLARAYDPTDFYRAIFAQADIVHIIGHSHKAELDVGVAKKKVRAADLPKQAASMGASVPTIVISTGCRLQSPAWRKGLKGAGAQALIATKDDVTPAALTAFDMAFYSALLAQVRKGKTLNERVEASFNVADRHYRAIHAKGTPFAKFECKTL